jgi:hypothetical protein
MNPNDKKLLKNPGDLKNPGNEVDSKSVSRRKFLGDELVRANRQAAQRFTYADYEKINEIMKNEKAAAELKRLFHIKIVGINKID